MSASSELANIIETVSPAATLSPFAANETVAEAITWLNVPFIYRVHEEPSDEKITVTIDGKEHSLDAKTHEKVELTVGEHTVENDKYKVAFTVYSDSKGGIIELHPKSWTQDWRCSFL